MNNLNEWQRNLIDGLKSQGFTVYIASSRPHRFYGFYTRDGGNLVSFQYDFLLSVGGSYVTSNPKGCGQGWQIANDINDQELLNNAEKFIEASAPQWAVNGSEWRYKTVAEHLEQYQASSKYVKQ